jgi:hypothetical protein
LHHRFDQEELTHGRFAGAGRKSGVRWFAPPLAIALSGCLGAGTITPPFAPAASRPDPAPVTTRLRPRIAEIQYANDKVWLRGVDRTLHAARKGARHPTRYLASEQVLDLHVTPHGKLWVLALDPHSGDARVWQRDTSGFAPIFEMAAPNFPLHAITDQDDEPMILGERAIFWTRDGALRSVSLDGEVRPGKVRMLAFAAANDGSAYVGINSGEWGGALARVDLENGEIRGIVRKDGPGLCTGPLNPNCDPITDVVQDPDSPRCVLASVGLSHFIQTGRLLRVCGEHVHVIPGPWSGANREPLATERLLEVLSPRPVENDELSGGDICNIDPAACPVPESSLFDGDSAIFGLARTKRGVWIATTTGLYHRSGGQLVSVGLPKFQPFGATAIAWGPGVVSVATDANWAASVSGFTPLVAATRIEGPAPVAVELPLSTCWQNHDESSLLCFEKDRHFVFRHGRWNSERLRWQTSKTEVTAVLETGPKLSLKVRGESLEVRLDFEKRSLLGALDRMSGEPLERVQREIRALPRVEDVCRRAERCQPPVDEGMEQESPPGGPLPRDLVSCAAWLDAHSEHCPH